MKANVLFVGVCLMSGTISQAASLTNFEDLPLATGSRWNGSDGSGGFASGGAYFNNSYTNWGGGYYSWGGWSYSNIKDSSSYGLTSQYNAISGGGQSGDIYAVGYVDAYNAVKPVITLNTEQVVSGLYVTNVNYAYYSMLDGYMVAKKFGGESGSDPDWFLLTITGKDAQGVARGTVNFYLADFQFVDNSKDYIVNTWQYINLNSLGLVKSLEFNLSSSDNDLIYGMNTPAYFALDTVIPEPATVVLLMMGGLLMNKKIFYV